MQLRRTITSIAFIIGILLLSILFGKWLYDNRNRPEEKPLVPYVLKVRVIEASSKPFEIYVEASGKIEASKSPRIAAEVVGKVISISPRLEIGEVLQKGETIVEIDPSDYETAVANATAAKADAEAAVANAKLQLVQETARAEQNIREWRKLGKGEPSDLVARVPQLASAKAALAAAEASVIQADEAIIKARRDLDKTKVVAPYALKVDQKHVEKGNFLMTGGMILDGHSEGDLQVRLPITLSDYLLVKDRSKPIQLTATLGTEALVWKADFLRSEGRVDQSTLTLPIIAKILPNESLGEFKYPPVGLFVKAKIHADSRDNVMVLPRGAVQLGDKVMLVDAEGRLRIREVKVVFTTENEAVVEGVKDGEKVVVSPIETPVEGMDVLIANSSKEPSHTENLNQ